MTGPVAGPVAGPARWGIIGTAGIARGAFLPGLRAAGGGVPVAVTGRDLARARQYADANGIERAIGGYQNLIDDPAVDAVYVPLPNGLHAEWTIQALRAGKPVLCEKPLCGSVADTERVLGAARETGTWLWEAFVFPFHSQIKHVWALLADGVIGELREIQSTFQVLLDRPADIRMSRDLAGGAANDLACYPVRLARLLFAAEYESAWAAARWGGDGVDIDIQGSLGFPGDRRLLFSCGFGRSFDACTRLLGTAGQIHLSNPFLPGPHDHLIVHAPGTEARRYPSGQGEPTFAAALRHIHAALRGEQPPRSLAVDTSLGNAAALHDLLDSAAPGRP